MSQRNEPVVVEITDIERLEFSGTRNNDGSIEAMEKRLRDWPERLVIGGVLFRREDVEDHRDEGENRTMAWYVIE